jgi:ribose-phosphate pyrophosphokinase
MRLCIIDGGANTPLAADVARALDVPLAKAIVARFPDLEANIQLLDSVADADVFIVQPTGPPADQRLMELLLLADAARRGGAASVAAVVPYFGYARQDHDGGRPIGAPLVAGMMEAAGIDRVITVDLHSPAVETAFDLPVSHLSAVPLLAERLGRVAPRGSIVVAPDLGAVKLADRYARLLDMPVAFVRKERMSGSAVEARGVVGPVAGRTPIIVDDMISTGGTIVAAAEACRGAGAARSAVYVAASHALLVGDAVDRLGQIPITALFTTDTVARSAAMPEYVTSASVAELLASEIARVENAAADTTFAQRTRRRKHERLARQP